MKKLIRNQLTVSWQCQSTAASNKMLLFYSLLKKNTERNNKMLKVFSLN